MTQKLKILGPYTPEHPGPFCTWDGQLVRIISKTEGSKEFPIVGMGHGDLCPSCWQATGKHSSTKINDDMGLMNAEEVPVAQEFWVNEYGATGWGQLHDRHAEAVRQGRGSDHIRTIHVREVLPGDGE